MALCATLKKKAVMAASVGIFLMALGIALIPIMQVIVYNKVVANVVLKEGGLLYKLWKNTTVPVYLQFYMFDIANEEEMKNGAKPSLDQKGPYTYSEERFKVNITHHPNGTVSYRQIRLFKFIRSMSCGNESDLVTTISPPLVTLLDALRYEKLRVRDVINLALEITQADLFITRPIKEVLWGYTDPLLKEAHKLDPDWFYTDFVGYFVNKNNTDDGLYTVYTGETDINLLGVVDKYNGLSTLDFWSTPWANMINGTDGTLARPFLGDTTTLNSFVSDVCRSVTGVYTSDGETKQGIAVRRYTSPRSQLADADENPDNIGFCTPMTNCYKTGVLNVSTCQMFDFFKTPAAVSFPHFYMADKSFTDAVYGMHPNKAEHETAVDIEPLTGLVLQATKKLQMNMHIVPVQGIKQTELIRDVVLPILWVNESTSIDDSHAAQLQDMMFTPLLVANVIKYGLIAIGSTMLVLALLYGTYIAKRLDKKKPKEDDKEPLIVNDHSPNLRT